MPRPTFSVPSEMLDEADKRADEAGVNRSRYIREALVARFEEEDAGDWEAPEGYPIEVDAL